MLTELLSDLQFRLRALVRRDDLERELADELRFHIEHEAEKYERAGVPRHEALRRARLALGGVERTKEASRDTRGTVLLETTLQDLRYAIRGLRAKPAFTLGVVLTLGLGIGANAAMFGIVDRLLLRAPTFLRDPARVHRIYQTATYNGVVDTQGGTRFPRFLDFKQFTQSFSSITAFSTNDIAIGDGVDARERPVTAASASYFELFDMRPALGRFFTADDDRAPTGAPVVVLGYAYWQATYSGRADVLGKTVRVGRTTCTIIGVAPAGFTGVANQGVPAMYMPITTFAWDQRGSDIRPKYDYVTDYGWFWLELVAVRRPGVSIAAADADLTQALERSWRKENNGSEDGIRNAHPHANLAAIQLGRGPEAGPEAKVVVWVAAVALIVLLIACANVANLLLARALSRQREIALRLALGVSRSRLARQLFTESLVLAALGGAIGLAVAHWGGSVLRTLFLPPEFGTGFVTDTRTLIVAFSVTVAAALLTGSAPLWQALRYNVSLTLNAAGRDTGSRPSALRTALLLLQATLSVVLLIGAGLFVRSLYNVRTTHLGFDVDPLVVVTENLRGSKVTNVEQIALEHRLLTAARSIPGVVSATRSPSVPYWGFEGRGLFVPGVDSVMTRGNFFMQPGDPTFFATYGTRIIRGRSFDERDGPKSAPVIVISEGMANLLWPGSEAIGKCIRIEEATAPCRAVIGVAEEMRVHSFTGRGRRDGRRDFTYAVPMTQYEYPAGTIVVRVAGDAADYAESVRRYLQPSMPGAAYVTAVPLRTIVDPQMQSWRMGATMFAAFAALALALAGIGLYSVIAYGVAQRRQEIGVRIALGASRPHVVRLVVRGGLRLVVLGVLLGASISLAAARWVAPLLFQESPRDPLVYGAVAAVLVTVSLVATALPALAASRVDPNLALRAD
jgi:putative ABC transport system permease protein